MTPKEFCEKYRIRNFTINDDDTIDVNGHVDLWNKLGNMKKLPVKFGNVSDFFDCSDNKLTTLEGCPNYIGTGFFCYGKKINILTTLEYCPKYIGNDVTTDTLTHHILGNVRGNIRFIIHAIQLSHKQKKRIVI
jgi:hypothetical protein